MPKGKLQRRWLKGVWLGKLDRDDSHVIGTSAGAIAVRSIRRLPREAQINKELMNEMKGIPWQPRDGVRHKVTREVSHPAIIPAPASAAEAPTAEESKDETHPTLAEDGEKVDEEGVTVIAAAQLEELIGPMDDEGEHFSAGIAAEDDMVDSPSPPPSPPPTASGSSPPFRGAGWSSNLQSLPDEPISPSGLGEGGKREREMSAHLIPGESEPKQSRQAGVLQHLTNREIWGKIQEWGNAEEASNPTAIQRVSNVTDFVDQLLDPLEVEKARKQQLAKLWARGAFTPVHKSEIPFGSQIFSHKWVDKCSKGVHKSRFTCADVKARYSAEEEEGLDVFVPTPTPESHNLLEVYALQNEFYTRSLDIVAAFLIGKDRGATEGKPVYVRAPVEWHDLFLEWLETLNPQERAWYKEHFKEIHFRLDGNLYGRRTAGSVYRNELEEILCSRVDPQQYAFVRGQKDPCVFRCTKTGIILLHHIDDIRAAGPEEALAQLFEKELPRHCEVQAGELEREGTAVEYLGRTKIRTKDAIITVPDDRHYKAVISAAGITAKDRSEVPSKQLNLLETEPLDEAQCKKFRSAVGSAIYLSLDRRDIQFAVKEAARRMSNPRKCDMQSVRTLAAYLQAHPTIARVITCDQKVGEPWSIELYSDSDWAGCLETRRSTDSHLAMVAGAVVTCTTQTQPGLPATSSPDAELRGVSRAAREGIFLKDLITLDFGQTCGKPRLWTDSSSAIQASKRIGPGAKLRHLEVCEFYVQGALQAKLLSLGKVKGTVNCANFLTKHPKSGTEVRQALPGLGMYEPPKGEDILSTSKHINVKVSQISKQPIWKTPVPASVAWTHKQAEGAGKAATVTHGGAKVNAIKALVFLTQIGAAKAQRQEIDTWQLLILYVLAAIGIIAVWWKMCQLSWQLGEWMFPVQPAEPTPPQGAEVQLRLQGSQVQLRVRFTATRNGEELAIQTGHSSIAAPAEAPRQEGVELTPQAVEREYEERWVQRGAQERMTLEELIRWRRQEERLIHGEDPHSDEDQASSEDEESLDERVVPPERDAPPERSDPPERAEPPA